MATLHPSVRKLGWVSFLNDASSEMVYPMLPAFLATLGATPAALGVLEGLAEATASVVRIVSGRLSDARVQILNRCGHWTTIERPQECNQVLKELLGGRA